MHIYINHGRRENAESNYQIPGKQTLESLDPGLLEPFLPTNWEKIQNSKLSLRVLRAFVYLVKFIEMKSEVYPVGSENRTGAYLTVAPQGNSTGALITKFAVSIPQFTIPKPLNSSIIFYLSIPKFNETFFYHILHILPDQGSF